MFKRDYVAQLDVLVSQPHLYKGDYEVDPSHEVQTLSTAGLKMLGDVTVNAVDNQDKTATPTESEQVITPDTGKDGLDSVTVEAIPSTYVGSGIARKSSSDMTAIGPIVTAPAGYYASDGVKRVASGTQGTPVAVKSAVANNKVTITPKVDNVSGYIMVVVSPDNPDGTIFGTPVEVSASELVSGSLSINESGTVDVTNYATVDVDIPLDFSVLSVSDDGNGTVIFYT